METNENKKRCAVYIGESVRLGNMVHQLMVSDGCKPNPNIAQMCVDWQQRNNQKTYLLCRASPGQPEITFHNDPCGMLPYDAATQMGALIEFFDAPAEKKEAPPPATRR